MTGAVPAGAAEAYEGLRSSLLDPAGPTGCVSGRAMLLRHGMLAWAQAWDPAPAAPPVPRSLGAAARGPGFSDVTPELVQLIAGLILNHHKGAWRCPN